MRKGLVIHAPTIFSLETHKKIGSSVPCLYASNTFTLDKMYWFHCKRWLGHCKQHMVVVCCSIRFLYQCMTTKSCLTFCSSQSCLVWQKNHIRCHTKLLTSCDMLDKCLDKCRVCVIFFFLSSLIFLHHSEWISPMWLAPRSDVESLNHISKGNYE